MRVVDRAYLNDLHAAIDLMTVVAEEQFETNAKAAQAIGIGVQTLQNLRSHHTRLPQHYTLVKLARATGFHVEFIRGTVTMRNARKRKAS